MSMHKIPLTQLEEDGLRAHGLDIGSPSQLSDVFRHGIKWALEQTAPQPSPDALINGAKALLALDESGSLVPHGIGGLAREVIEKLIVRVEQTAPQPEQSGLANKLRALAEIWAQNADEADEFGNAQAAEALRLAAFELRAALSAPQEAPDAQGVPGDR